MTRYTQLLGTLSERITAGTMDLAAAAVVVAEYVATEFQCSRGSIWLLEGDGEARVMRRLAAYCSATRQPVAAPVVLTGAQFGAYFDALRCDGGYVCHDVLADPKLEPMMRPHLGPEDIRASLSAVIGVNASTSAILTCSQLRQPRRWLPHEVTLLKRIANEISIRRARRRVAEQQAQDLLGALLDTAITSS
jgi:GAF domain-containing protein